MEKNSIQELIDRCITFFQDSNYTTNRIGVYRSLWKKGIVKYMEEHNLTEYSSEVGKVFISICHTNGEVRPKDREKIRSVQVLDDMLATGIIRKRCYEPVFHALPGVIGAEMERFITYLASLRRSQTTINDYRLYLSEFLTHLTQCGVNRIEDIEERHIVTFVASHPTNKVNIVSAIRVLYRYWKENGVTQKTHEDLLTNYKVKKREVLPSFFSAEEVIKMEQTIQRSSATGKRNYAMFLLASRLGLRASDIAGLQFSYIDWEKNIITLTMKKTRKVIELPLLADVGNALIQYLQYGRPKSSLQSVFISTRAPYVAATKEMVCSAINSAILSSGVETGGKHHGPHSLRHSLATTMLGNGTSMPVISESLGHRSTQTTLTYLKIDLKELLACVLPVPEIPTDFYLQRGGAFYG